jgi:hypothetical protein
LWALGLAIVLGAICAAPANAASKPKPRFARSIVLAPVTGRVLVKRPGSPSRRLTGGTLVRTGATVDTTQGMVRLTTALPGGKTQFGLFHGGAFVVTQPRAARGLTDLTLAGGSLGKCPKPSATANPRVTAAASPHRRLFGHAHGRFRTRGRSSSATVRGTKWMTEDRCDGTHTTDIQGRVDTAAQDGLAFKLNPGQVITYYCSPRSNPPGPGTYCLDLLATPKAGLISNGIIDITDETQYDLCVTGPGNGQEVCGTAQLSDPMQFGFRTSAITCFTHRGTGVHTVRWRVGGVFLYPPLSVSLTDPMASRPDCLHFPKLTAPFA